MSEGEQTIPVRRCTTVGGDGGVSVSLHVFCPDARHSRDASTCKGCEHLVALGVAGQGQVVRCTPSTAPPSLDPRADQRERAARIPIHEIASTQVVCVKGDASNEEAKALILEHDLRCLPVVDDERRLLGIVTRSDLLRESVLDGGSTLEAPPELGPGFHVEELAPCLVSQVMTPRVHALPEQAPLSFAVALMATEGVHEVPVVTEEGRLVGVLTALDALRWLATELGYRLPAPPKARAPSAQ